MSTEHPRPRMGYTVFFAATLSVSMLLFGQINTATAQETIKIGVPAPITGAAAADGEEMVRGLRLAVEEANKNQAVPGYTFEVVEADTEEMSGASVVSAIQRLLREDNLHAIITGYASNTNFEIEYLAEERMPYLLAGQSQQTREIISPDPSAFPTVWSYTPSYDAYETALPVVLDMIESESGLSFDERTVALITSDNAYSMSIYEGLRKSFVDAGWQIVFEETLPFGEIGDWRSTLAGIRSAEPDVIVNADYLPGNGARFMRQFVQNPIDSLMFIQYAPSVPEFVQLTKEDSDGIVYNILGAPIVTEANPRAIELMEKYRQRWGVESGMYGIATYEMAQLYFDALKKVGDPTDHLAIAKVIGQTDKRTASGRLVFDQETHLAMQGDEYFPIQFLQLWNGERHLFYPPAYATSEFRIPPWMRQSEN